LYLEQAVALDPQMKEAHYQLGLTYRRLGEQQKSAEAMSRFRRLKQVDGPVEQDGSSGSGSASKDGVAR
jgi:Tfp pilus assembly protein PilF